MRALPRSAALLGERLESLYRLYGPETTATDPIVFPRRYAAPEDREVTGWIASAFAYGQVRTIQDNVGRILDALGPRRRGTGVDRRLPRVRARTARGLPAPLSRGPRRGRPALRDRARPQ